MTILRDTPSKMRRAIVIFASGLILIFAIEICARIDDKIRYGAPFFGDYSSALLRAKDPEGINSNVPNSHFEKWNINRFGFRGRDVSIRKPKGVTRIICMGTSETFGLYESPGREWPNQLNNMLNGDNHFQVINTSVVGLPLKKYRRYIEKYVIRFEPDVIILLINPFDYAVGTEKFAKRQNTSQKHINEGLKRKIFDLKNIIYTFRILPKFKQVLKTLIPEEVLRKYQIWDMERQLQGLERRRLDGNKPINVISNQSLDGFRSDLEELVEFLRHQKIKVILSSYPVLISSENIDKHLEVFLDHRRFYIELSLQGIIDASVKFDEVIKRVANDYSIGFIDNNAALSKDSRNFADNVHYTDEGARLVALNFATYIRKQRTDNVILSDEQTGRN
jgi:hypothetical protein